MSEETATPIEGAVRVLQVNEVGPLSILTVDCPDGYASFKQLPEGVEYAGREYGKSAFDSDMGKAWYRTDKPIARAIRKGKAK